ncbi:MAG: DUF3368 domain-containing protein [Deltaproteobacteria bacterium]|nr:DUF3368 domain-containing protein [Deltaproteobacteria bacterium]
MAVSPRLCIVDASVLIDLEKADLVQEFLQLRCRWATPEAVVYEVGESLGSALTTGGLAVIDMTADEVQDVLRLRERYNRVSISDLFCLVLARNRKAVLITGDQPLRKAAEAEGVRVRGTLWMLDEMVTSRIIPGFKAAEALSRMIAGGGRFPPEECRKRLKKWGT